MKYEEKLLSTKPIYSGNIIDIEVRTVELPNGAQATRDVVKHPGASVVVPLTEEGEIYMVRQYRTPIYQESLEIPAGRLNKGEAPLDCAIRELKEETGLTSSNVSHLVSVYSAPGFSDEILHLYLARDLKEGESCADEDEFISTEKFHVDELVKKILQHEITDAKTIIGILLADKIVKNEIL